MRVASIVLFVAASMPSDGQSQTTPDVAAASSTAADATPVATDAANPAGPCDADPFRQFDFWAGHWVVKNVSGREVGRNSIQLEQRGCALIERWMSAEGNTGVSLNFYDPGARTWRQHWISPGTVLAMQGGLVDGAMVLEGPLQYVKEGRTTLLRGTWTPLPDGRVRQHFVESADQGKTWTDWFDGYYSRR
jgi:hypothetical protein